MNRNKGLSILPILSAGAICAAGVAACNSGGETADVTLPDTVRVVTLYGPSSYFEYKDTLMGYDYEMMEELAKEHGFAVDWIVAGSLDQAINMVNGDSALILASDVPSKEEYKRRVQLCGPKNFVEHVLVQPPGDTVIVDVNQLAGHTVYVEKGSKSEEELEKINKSLGGKIGIRPVDPDSLATEDMLAAVAHGDIRLAIVDSKTARLNRTYYPDMNITLAITAPELAQWAVAHSNKGLAKMLDRWMTDSLPLQRQGEILTKYFETLKNQPVEGAGYDRNFANGYASPFDHYYKEHTDGSHWDWRLLAAQGYAESRFNPTAKSWAGATGVMQIMPKTARDFGLKKSEMTDPSRSIETAVKILNHYENLILPYVEDPIERQKFVIASYNSGPGHVLDAIRLAKKYGYDPQVWDDNVEKAMLMKMNKKYYRDPVVRHGYSRGRETVDYVDRIWNYYGDAIQKIPA
ncbi:MAG: transglycosylase SLT domain-containing protein [Clostridium sp.]|nr:transglycosylase SLT domain-containing protein [Clostridium sp.]